MNRRIVQGALLAALVLSPAIAQGQTTLATAYPGVLGQGQSNSIAAASQLYVRYTLAANRSYYAVCWSPFGTDQAADCNVDWRNASDVSVGVTSEIEPFNSPFTTFGGDGDSMLPTTGGSYYVRTSNFSAGTATINVMVVENTLFSPWWYVLAASGYDSWVQIRNNTTQTITVTLRAYSNTGALLGSTSTAISANGVALVQMSTIASGAGSASLTFAGPPGSIAANTTTLSGSTGLSFDAPFAPRMGWATFGALQ
jgi:hypothetical protein